MQLEDFFDFVGDPPEAIRLKGTRIDLESVVHLYRQHMTPEQMSAHYGGSVKPVLLYAGVTYYLANQAEVEAYLARSEEITRAIWEREATRPETELSRRLRDVKARLANGGPFTDEELASDSFRRLRDHWGSKRQDVLPGQALERSTHGHADRPAPQSPGVM